MGSNKADFKQYFAQKSVVTYGSAIILVNNLYKRSVTIHNYSDGFK